LNQVSTRKVDRIRYGDVEYGYVNSYSADAYEAETSGAVSRRDLKSRKIKR
jgi:hypothetical protein